jgi:hypothetical protein
MKLNPKDAVSMDIPLLIRMFEFMREEAKSDEEVHDVTEKLISLSLHDNVLTMNDYPQIVPEKAPEENPENPEIERMKQLSGMGKY